MRLLRAVIIFQKAAESSLGLFKLLFFLQPEVRGIDDPFEMKHGETTCKASEKPLG
jgi:hypothetical protein